MAYRLQNKVVLITGAARGIGASIAECCAREHAKVIITDVDRSGADVADALVRDGWAASFRLLDVRDAHAWSVLAAETRRLYGRIDGLVNNAAVQIKHSPLDMPDAQWDVCMDVNLRGVWRGCQAVLPTMIEQAAGSIVNLSSVHGQQIIPGGFPYSVSKHGVVGITHALGVEYAPCGVRVNAISPGYVDTDPAEWVTDPEGLWRIRALVPARRLARPEEVAMTSVFLLSDEAPYIVATTITIDGGRVALFHE